jgi:hypothetical protein
VNDDLYQKERIALARSAIRLMCLLLVVTVCLGVAMSFEYQYLRGSRQVGDRNGRLLCLDLAAHHVDTEDCR